MSTVLGCVRHWTAIGRVAVPRHGCLTIEADPALEEHSRNSSQVRGGILYGMIILGERKLAHMGCAWCHDTESQGLSWTRNSSSRPDK